MAASRWCRSCGGEFQADLTTCPDCGVPLEDTPPPPGGEDPYFEEAVAAFASARVATRVLRVMSLVAFAIWFVGTASLALEMWDAIGEEGANFFGIGQNRFTTVISQVAGSTSGYLLVAVLAYAASVIIDLGRAKDMLQVADRES